jgi:hypothetical protein
MADNTTNGVMDTPVEDVIPKTADTSDEAILKLFQTAGYENKNTELAEIEREAGIKPKESVVAPPAPVEPAINPTETQPKVEVPKDGLFDDILNPGEVQPTTPVEPQQVPQGDVYTKDQVDQMVQEAVTQAQEQWKNVSAVQEEFQKDPYAFYAKYSPHIMENFNQEAWVKDQLDKEFGETFEFVPEQLGDPNSLSSKFLERRIELRSEANQKVQESKATLEQQKAASAQAEQSFVKSMVDKYKFSSIEDFNQNVWSKISSLSTEEFYERLVRYELMVSRLDQIKSGIKAPTNRAYSVPGVTNLNGSPSQPGVNDDDKALGQFFSQERLEASRNTYN